MIVTLALALLLLTAPLAAEEFQGKVVGITDGDTIHVLPRRVGPPPGQ